PLADVTEGDADEWRAWLSSHEQKSADGKILKSKLSPNTVRRHCGRARQIFRAAMKHRLITSNPFGEMKGISVQANKAREFFVTREMTGKVLDACPDAEWRLLFALARFGGLRCPSEILLLRWCDAHWPVPTSEDARERAGWIRITSPKTEHHEGHGERIIPMF